MEEQTKEATDDRQGEHHEGSNEKNAEADALDVKKWEFALSVLKEAVSYAGIKDISEYKGEPLDLRWHIFYREVPNNVLLVMIINGIFGTIHEEVELIITARWIVNEVEGVLNQPDANRLFDFTPEEYLEVLRENARMILIGLIQQIPLVSYHSLNQALHDAAQAHIKTYVQPLLKEHWQSIGLSKDFTIAPSEGFTKHQKSIDEQFKVLRQSFLGNKRARLTDERRANLPNEYEQLRLEYQKAKDFHDQTREIFFAGKRNRTFDDWREEWETLSLRMFPNLFYQCLYEINDYQPYELAHRQMADYYGHKPDYMPKLIRQAAALKPKKSQ